MPQEDSTQPQNTPDSASGNDNVQPPRSNLPYYLAGIILIGGVLAVHFFGKIQTDSIKPVRLPLPEILGAWSSREIEVTEAERTILPKDTEISKRLYNNGTGLEVFAVVVVSGAERRSIHRPEYCLPGQGWAIGSSSILTHCRSKDGTPLKVSKITAVRMDKLPDGREIQRKLVDLYWFIGQGRSTPHHWQRIFWTTSDRLFKGINHRWAFVSLFGEVTGQWGPGGLDETRTEQVLLHFIDTLEPHLVNTDSPVPIP